MKPAHQSDWRGGGPFHTALKGCAASLCDRWVRLVGPLERGAWPKSTKPFKEVPYTVDRLSCGRRASRRPVRRVVGWRGVPFVVTRATPLRIGLLGGRAACRYGMGGARVAVAVVVPLRGFASPTTGPVGDAAHHGTTPCGAPPRPRAPPPHRPAAGTRGPPAASCRASPVLLHRGRCVGPADGAAVAVTPSARSPPLAPRGCHSVCSAATVAIAASSASSPTRPSLPPHLPLTVGVG